MTVVLKGFVQEFELILALANNYNDFESRQFKSISAIKFSGLGLLHSPQSEASDYGNAINQSIGFCKQP